MAVTTLLLILAGLCQLILVWICIGGLMELISRQTMGGEDATTRSRTAIGLPATMAVVLNAAFLNTALVVLSFPSFMKGELSYGLFFLSGGGFGGFAIAALATMGATRSRSGPLVAQLAISVVGLISVFAAYYRAGAS